MPGVLGEIGPDLVALQEAQIWGRPRLWLLDESALLREAGLRVLRPAPDAQGWRGNAMLAGLDTRLLRGPTPLGLGGWEPRGALVAEVEWRGRRLRVATAHLSLGARDRLRQARTLLAALREGEEMPALLLADVNEGSGAALSELEAALPGAPARPATFPSARPLRALDHALGSPGLVEGVSAHASPLARRASDHLPLVARLRLA